VLAKIISGGQSGVDRGALDAALESQLPCGGYCPRGRRAEDGPIDSRYPMDELDSPRYPDRTEANVRAADATLILTRGAPSGGTALTAELARRHSCPMLVIDLADCDEGQAAKAIASWLRDEGIEILNVAGPRESGAPGIAAAARRVMSAVIDEVRLPGE
jgi:hypothetical protein